MEDIIRRVWLAKAKGTKLITIPKDCDIKVGDYVSIKKVEVDGDG